MRYFAEDIGDYAALLNNLYACEEGWISFKEMVDILCSLIKKGQYQFTQELEAAILQ